MMKVNNDVNDDVNDGKKIKFWITSKSKFTSSSKIKCKYESFNPCKEWFKFLKFTWKFTAFTTFVEKTGDWVK